MTNISDECYSKLGIRSKELEEGYKTRSQIAGWSLLLVAMSAVFALICIHRCIGGKQLVRLPSIEYYRHIEAKEAFEQFHAKAKELARQNAKQNIQLLFQNAKNNDIDICIQEVSKSVQSKYEMYFAEPPESPTYEKPQVSFGDDSAQFLDFSDEAKVSKNKYHKHNRSEHMECSRQTQSTSENRKHGKAVSNGHQ